MTPGLLLALSLALAPSPQRPPNVVIVLIDDMGYADIGPFGAKGYSTPNLDRMARQGMKLTDFYVTQAVCSASRAGLLTGRYNLRTGVFGALGPHAKRGLPPEEVTIAELAKQRGYATACFGKWHLGHRRPYLPRQQGFDEYFGLPYSNDMWPHHPGVRHLPMEERRKRWPDLPLYEGDEVVDAEVTAEDQRMLTTWYTERAVDFVERHRERPFFLYLAHSMVHVPLFVSEKFAGRSGAGLFGDVVQEVDWSVGRILETIERLGLARDTVVFFTSDNGPWLSYGDHAGSAGPLREGKGTMFEGGCRVPALAWGPGRIPAGSVCSEPAMTIDLFPTIAELIGAELPDRPIDGRSILPLLEGRPGARSPHEALLLYYGKQLHAIRAGRYKLHLPHAYRTLGGRPGGKGGLPARYQQARIGLSLFDLEADVGETADVKDRHPEVVTRMLALADRMRAELGDPRPPAGFTRLFDGESLEGWWGAGTEDPRGYLDLPPKALAELERASLPEVRKHWRVEDGELVNDGRGPYLTTDRFYQDFELRLQYRTVPRADSGVYLRGIPQVQIWDTTKAGGKWRLGADKGSGGLWNNSPGSPGKDPLVHADKPFGEWNDVRVVMVGERVSVWLNGKLTVDHARLENYFDRSRPIPRRGPIQLQTHGGEIRWRNLLIREIAPREANRILRRGGPNGRAENLPWTSLFDGKTLEGWQGAKQGYAVRDGAIVCRKGHGGTLFTERSFSDFVVQLEILIPPGGNNGLAIRYPGRGDPAYSGMCELQVLDNTHPRYARLDPRQYHGSAYGQWPAHRGYLRPPGTWNFQEVTVQGSRVRVELNGTVILDKDLATVKEFMYDAAKFAGRGRKDGYFGFAGHNDPVRFRRIRIREL